MAEIGHFIAGEYLFDAVAPNQGVFNPATGEQTSIVTLGGKPEVDKAMAASLAAWPEWADMPVLRRARILDRFKAIMTERTDQLAHAITAEHGKTLEDAAGEITRGLEVVEFALGAPHFKRGVFGKCRQRCGQLFHAPAAGRCGRYHPVQFSGHGADVDVPDCAGDRELLYSETL